MDYRLSKIVATHCCVCRSPLTDAESIEHGIGPVCSRRYYSPRHTPTQEQVQTTMGLLSASALPNGIVDDFLSVVDNTNVNARAGCNLLVKWASANYDQQKIVFECSGIIRALGYTELADKLENDRTKVTIHVNGGTVEAFTPDKYTMNKDILGIPGAFPIRNPDGTVMTLGKKIGWSFGKEHLAQFEAILGVHLSGELMCGTGGIRVIPKRRWSDILAFREPKADAQTGGTVQVNNVGAKLEVYSPYNFNFILELKRAIPIRDRVWTGRCWSVSLAFRDVVKQLITTHYGEAV